VKNRDYSRKRDGEILESQIMFLPKSFESKLQRNSSTTTPEFSFEGYSKPYYLDTGVGLGFQYAGLMEILRSHLNSKLQIADQVSFEWLRLRVRHQLEEVVTAAGALCDEKWNYVDTTGYPFFEIKEIQSWITETEIPELGETSLGEAVVIYLAKINGGVVVSNDARALQVSSELGVVCGHQGHLLRQLVYYRLVEAREAFEKFLKMCWISDLKREVKRKVKVNWFHEANV
jgi:hypothetical protein